jgi:heme exporter protein D
MASGSNKGDENRFLWIAGTAAVTALVVYQVNKYMKEREQLADMRAMEKLQAQLNGALKA